MSTSGAEPDRARRESTVTPGIAAFVGPATAAVVRIPATYITLNGAGPVSGRTFLLTIAALSVVCFVTILVTARPTTNEGKAALWLLGIPCVLFALGMALEILSGGSGHPSIGGFAWILVGVLSFILGIPAVAILARAYACGESVAFTRIAVVLFYVLAVAA